MGEIAKNVTFFEKNIKKSEKILQKNLEVIKFCVPLQSQNKQSGGGEMVDTLL